MKNSSIIGLKDLREKTEKYIHKIQEGKSFTVVRKSKPIFKISPVDTWGDEGSWKTVADFTDIDSRGVDARDILKSLGKLNGSNS